MAYPAQNVHSPLLALLGAANPKPKPKPKPPPGTGPVVPLPGWPTREGLDRPTIWKGKPKPNKMTPLELMLQRLSA